MITPVRLRPGDRVALVAPASPLHVDALDRGVAELAALGFDAAYDTRVLSRTGYVAGSPETRAAVVADAWRDPSIRAIVAARGGYGSVQLLPMLDPALARDARKPFVGYSDITAMLSWHLRAGLVAFHGPMVDRRLAAGPDAYDRASLLAALTNPAPMGELSPETLECLKPGTARGMLTGGTLTQLAASLGTPWAFDPPEGCVLFLEDVGERPYRVDRLLTQLRQAGILARAGAIVFGMFPNCDEPGGAIAVRDVLLSLTAGFPGPVLFGFPSGHGAGPTWTLPFGVRAAVIGGARAALVVEEAAVS